jgi:hypothetical protein
MAGASAFQLARSQLAGSGVKATVPAGRPAPFSPPLPGPLETPRVADFIAGPGRRIREEIARCSNSPAAGSWLAVLKALDAAPDEAAAQAIGRVLLHAVDTGALEAVARRSGASCRMGAFVRALAALGLRAGSWVRPVEAWVPEEAGRPDASQRPVLFQLARHLLVTWEMPDFMDSVWLADAITWREYHDWYVHLGAGGSAGDGSSPLQVKKNQARFLAEVPRHYVLPGHAYRVRAFLEARSLGAAPEFAHVLAESRLGDSRLASANAVRRGFWMQVARYLIRCENFPVRQIDPVIDYLSDMKFGWSAGVAPPMPGLSMKGRAPETLVRGMLLWREDRRRGELGNATFKPCGRKGFELKDEAGRPVWRITELLSSKELHREGQAMCHCVKTYALACVMGRCSIWSMTRIASDGRTLRKLTVEVSPAGRIAQARGRYNRWPMPEERRVLGLWAGAEKLELPNVAMGLLPDGLSPIPRPR